MNRFFCVEKHYILRNSSSHQISAQKFIVGAVPSENDTPSIMNAVNISQMVVDWNRMHQPIENGIFTKIIVRFRPSVSVLDLYVI